MRPIYIDNNLVDFAKDFSSNLFKDKNEKFIHPKEGLSNLLTKYTQIAFPSENKILNFIIDNYDKKLLIYTPQEQQRLVKIIDVKFPNIFVNGKKATDFSNDIVDKLRYDTLQEDEAYKIAEKLNIKTCPYCNAMLTVVITKDKSKKKARYQLDHFFPKSKYPFLCISFFNLIPCCSNCNQSKSSKNVSIKSDFHLYSKDTPLDAFKFSLDKADVIKKIIGVKEVDINIIFSHKISNYKDFVEKHNKDYNIQSLYNTQKDIVVELIWKTQAYDDQKIIELEGLLEIDKSSVKRMIIGNYADYEDIHKRPLAKFMQDIAEDLKLIKLYE